MPLTRSARRPSISKDDLLHDFKTGKFFEIDEFNFGVGLEDDDLSVKSQGKNSAKS